uniref:Uncharacterized protein n=1 Tax=Parascaris equorum TaxID=6256 RepID=A0A914R6Q4_PAREQ
MPKGEELMRDGFFPGRRTCLVIAHRLSTIQNSNLIVVINEGKVAEKGPSLKFLFL